MSRSVDAPPLGRLIHYEIKGLFGLYNHAFDLEVEDPTILSGANGTGKSTVLRSLEALSRGDWDTVSELPVASLKLTFERNFELRVICSDDEVVISSGVNRWVYRKRTVPRRASSLWRARREAINLGDTERLDPVAVEAVLRALPPGAGAAHTRDYLWALTGAGAEERPDDWVLDFIKRFPVRLISDQRLTLLRPDGRPEPGTGREAVSHAASEYARQLKRLISLELARYATQSQRVDREFPQRVADAMAQGFEHEPDEIRMLLEKVTERRAKLQRVGLLDKDEVEQPFDERALDRPEVRPVIWTYAEVTLAKFDILEQFRRRLELFVDFLDERFGDKETVTAGEDGLHFEIKATKDVVDAAALSSGEQQMMVLAYQLLFATEPGTLLLIDEPEISLHVGWQSSFVDDIAEMGRSRDLQFLLASHSPVLIGGREELKRSLDHPQR